LKDLIMSVYPSLVDNDFASQIGTITLRNDGNGQYIAKWEHPTLPRPTEEQLA
jgi:hypothetical protein